MVNLTYATSDRKIWTRTEIQAIVDAGILPSLENLELINGELVDRMGKKHPHVFWTHLFLAWAQDVFGRGYARAESPIDVAPEDNEINEPEPDVVVTSKSLRDFTTNPGPDDLVLVIEVAVSTQRRDLGEKAEIYARMGLDDYWVLDVLANEIVIHRKPKEGRYQVVSRLSFNEEVSPIAAPESKISMVYLRDHYEL